MPDKYIKLVYNKIPVEFECPLSNAFDIIGISSVVDDSNVALKTVTIEAGGADAVNAAVALKSSLDESTDSVGILEHVCIADAACKTKTDRRAELNGELDLDALRSSFVPEIEPTADELLEDAIEEKYERSLWQQFKSLFGFGD